MQATDMSHLVPRATGTAIEPWLTDRRALYVLLYLHYAYPVVLLVVFLLAFTLESILTASPKAVVEGSTKTGPGGKPLPKNIKPSPEDRLKRAKKDFGRKQKTLINWLLVAVISTFLGTATNIIVHALKERPWWCGESSAIYVISAVFVWALVLTSLIDTAPSPAIAHAITWLVGLLLEVILLGAALAIYTKKHRELTSIPKKAPKRLKGPSVWEAVEISLALLRILLLAALLAFYVLFTALRYSRERAERSEEASERSERAHLLNGNANGSLEYGTLHNGDAEVHERGKNGHAVQAQPGWIRPTVAPSKSWWEYIRGYSVFFPYLWPSKSRRLQLVVIFCFVLVMLQRGINVLVPRQVGIVINKLSGEDGPVRLPWIDICLFIFYKMMQGSTGWLGALRSSLWIPVSQYSYQALSTSAFEHVHGLSLDFHLGKKTGEVLSALSKGNSINTFLEQVTFQMLPMLIDLGVAFAYFLIAFDAYYALVVAIITFLYIYITLRMAQWRADIRRVMVNASREEDAVKNDSMVSYETVKYFNAEAYEYNRYRDAVRTYQKAEYKVMISLNIMNVTQNMVFTVGLLVTCFIAAYQVTSGQQRVGRFVTLLTYMAQLQGPLNFFGTFYRSIQSAMINAERMLELFKEQPTVVDKEDAETLPKCSGEIRFDEVQFSYDKRKPALKGLSFRAAPGTTTALVGESGGGKSTVFRLLFRFYNAEAGRILVDDYDVQNITIDSLRRHIGVVPQDTVLFNESLMYNLKYANPDCSNEEVYAACRAASIHEKILGFPDGYETKVGERGLRLSGGEKQRVAIARTILKNPKIILLDEATAALDSETEQHIQSALSTLSQGRTMLVIAHRLSTITSADQILCLHAGQVVEAGTHHELLKLKGRYASMWRKQIRAERAAEEARVLTDRAEMLRREQMGSNVSENVSEDEAGTSRREGHKSGAGSGGGGDSGNGHAGGGGAAPQ